MKSSTRRRYARHRRQRDDLGNIYVYVSATMKAAVHLAQDYQDNLRTTKNTDLEKVKQSFDTSQKFILNQSDEIFRISTID